MICQIVQKLICGCPLPPPPPRKFGCGFQNKFKLVHNSCSTSRMKIRISVSLLLLDLVHCTLTKLEIHTSALAVDKALPTDKTRQIKPRLIFFMMCSNVQCFERNPSSNNLLLSGLEYVYVLETFESRIASRATGSIYTCETTDNDSWSEKCHPHKYVYKGASSA
jgi:hypothetical protein